MYACKLVGGQRVGYTLIGVTCSHWIIFMVMESMFRFSVMCTSPLEQVHRFDAKNLDDHSWATVPSYSYGLTPTKINVLLTMPLNSKVVLRNSLLILHSEELFFPLECVRIFV